MAPTIVVQPRGWRGCDEGYVAARAITCAEPLTVSVNMCSLNRVRYSVDRAGEQMTSSTIAWERIRQAGSKLTTPLHPDDYLRLVNPLWTARELRGRVEEVIRETDDAATLVIRPGWGWQYRHRPGQYVGIGVQVAGKFQWRSYSVSSPPERRGRGAHREGAPLELPGDLDPDADVLAGAMAVLPAPARPDDEGGGVVGLPDHLLDPPAQLARGPQRVDQAQVVVG